MTIPETPRDTHGVYLSVAVGGAYYAVDLRDEGAIDAAYTAWQLKQKDRVMTLTLLCGDKLTIAASMIGEFIRSTPEGRSRTRAFRAERERLDKVMEPREWESDG